ncbi:hypothetical protein [Candidatus Magnetominusculus dajiuhuensis]|uniref:hypothetical protein n=1 Tax=Candidatus Magnetominusculus dajiuhuensis TaxID=3137712 RepID=UPI003B437DC9
MITTVTSYLFQVTVGRKPTVTMYGEMKVLFSIAAISGVPFTSLTTYLAKKHISRDHALGERVVKKACKSIVIAAVVIFLKGIAQIRFLNESPHFLEVIEIRLNGKN